MNQSIKTKNIVNTLTTTSIELKATSTAVGFDTIMTLHHPHHPPTHPPQTGTLQHLWRENKAV